MAVNQVVILGGFQTDFARNFGREQKDIGTLLHETALGALHAATLSPNAIESIHVGNAFGELFNGQGHLGAMLASVDARFAGIAAMRHEAACASGSMAILSAMAEIEAGRYDCVLVLGAEQERHVSGEQAAAYMASASRVGHEGEGCKYLWPAMFSQVADEYQRRYGLQYEHLGAIAANNISNAKRNPNAQTRNWQFQAESFRQHDELNPVVEGWTRRQDCGQLTDGGAAVILASSRFAHVWATQRGQSLARLPRILGWGHRTASLALQAKLTEGDGLLFPHLRRAILDAFQRAGVQDVSQLQAIETHDCFSMTQYMAIDHFGITPPGQSWRAIESGELAFDGKLPINPSGGLIGGGHPVGATGVRMLWDAAKQVAGTAGDYQVPGAKRVATLNLGGSAATVASFVVGV